MASRLGFNAVGFVFAPSPRRLSPDKAREISQSLPSSICRVGVFVNEEPEEVARIFDYCELDLVQFHGEEPPDEVAKWGAKAIKAMRPRSREDLEKLADYAQAFAILIDTWDPLLPGGTGRKCDWDLAALAGVAGRVILAGGLNPDNVTEAISKVQPFGVDVCSGLESGTGIKDKALMLDFINKARTAGEHRGTTEDRDGEI